MTTLGNDTDQTRGQLLATRLVLQETLDRLPADQIDDLRCALDGLVTDLRATLDQALTPEQAHIVDEIEAVALRLRYRDQPIEHPAADQAGDRNWTGVCMRCEYFPIDIGMACPQCGTARWTTVVRS